VILLGNTMAAAVGRPLSDGVLEGCNDFFEIGRQVTAPLDGGPQRDRRRSDDAVTQRQRIEIVMEMWPAPAMARITRLPQAGPTVLPPTNPTDVVAELVRKKHVSASIDTLRVALQPARTPGQRCEVDIVSDNHEHVDVLRIRFRRNNRSDQGNPANARDVPSSVDELTQPVEQFRSPVLERLAHHPINAAAVPHWPALRPRLNALDPASD
jgi:hypothetical protein